MKTLNQQFINSALAAQLIRSCPSAELARPEPTGVLVIAYGAHDKNTIDT